MKATVISLIAALTIASNSWAASPERTNETQSLVPGLSLALSNQQLMQVRALIEPMNGIPILWQAALQDWRLRSHTQLGQFTEQLYVEHAINLFAH